ncbi:MAG: NAD(P)H-hydrate dehydratase [Candidatus Omnitrophota bacterium]|nr:MAG: NAD(P)H-hydrate dehydratase [Candidatus Omnitrophota bacterium]
MQLPVPLRKRKADTHKGDYGYVFVMGGSVGLTGALCLCAQAALRSGAGLVLAGVPESLIGIFETKLTEVMNLPLDEDRKGFLSARAFRKIEGIKEKIDVFALGPGASTKFSVKELVWKVLEEIDKPMVIDADGINALVDNLNRLDRKKTSQLVLTPHLGEFCRLMKLSVEDIKKSRKKLVKEFALRYNLTLVLKGPFTLVTDGSKLFENTTGNPGMATAGSGDVLTGIIASLIAQGLDCFSAAKLGVCLHGVAGDYAAKDKTENCVIASDIIEYLPKAFRKAYRK